MSSSFVTWRTAAFAILLILPGITPGLSADIATAQDSTSATLAAELTTLLSQQKLEAVAAKDADHFVGALYIPGSQLLVVSAKYPAPNRLDYLLETKSYRDAYLDLNGTPEQATKRFVSDFGADGLRFKPENDRPFDTVDVSGKSVAFDGEWRKAKMSKDEYVQAFQANDAEYSSMLTALIAALKKPS